jgi:hypothetical protein
VRGADAGLDQVVAAGPGHHVVKAKVVLGSQRVSLCGAGDEIARHVDQRRFSHVVVAVKIVLADDRNLVQHCGGEDGLHVRDEVVFAVLVVVGGSGEGLSADSLILRG